MSFSATVWAWRIIRDKKPKNPVDRLVLLAMADHAHRRSGKCWAAHEELADDIGVHRITIVRAQKRLRPYFPEGTVIDKPGWTTVWIFPTSVEGGVTLSASGVAESYTGCSSGLHKPVGNPKGTSRGVAPDGTPPPGKTHFLSGTGWV